MLKYFIACTHERIITHFLYLRGYTSHQYSMWLFQGRLQETLILVVCFYTPPCTVCYIDPSFKWH